MSDPSPRDWDEVARTKLERVLGPHEGGLVYAAVLAELNVPRLATINDFVAASTALSKRGGFAGTVGSLLSVHAMIHREQ